MNLSLSRDNICRFVPNDARVAVPAAVTCALRPGWVGDLRLGGWRPPRSAQGGDVRGPANDSEKSWRPSPT